jgi:hypothetical protein
MVEEVDDRRLQRMQLITNAHRKGLMDYQKAMAIAAIYEDAGFTKEQALSLVHKMWNSRAAQNTVKASFKEAFEAIGYSAASQINLLGFLGLDEDIAKQADEQRISLSTKTMLANSKEFKVKPKAVQEVIVSRLKGYGQWPRRLL